MPNNRMKNKKTILGIIAALVAFSMFSQVVPPPIPPPPPPGLPVDGGLIFLLVSGAIYGAYKLKK